MLGEDGEDLALITALYPGMSKFFHQHLVAGHGPAGEAAGDEDIAGTVVQHDEGEVFAQLDHLAQQGLLGPAGANGEEHALPLADDSVVDQLVQRLHHLAVRAPVAAELCFHILDGARLILDHMLQFFTQCHRF